MILIVILAISFLVALSVHEFAHAWAADKLGDPNPKIAGRLSLNPLAHLDPVGTVILPLFLIMSGSPIVFGWAKPVEVDQFNLQNPRRDMGLLALAGPTANLLLAIMTAFVLKLTGTTTNLALSTFSLGLIYLISTNVALAIFNLIPIHPLDGGKIPVSYTHLRAHET